MIILSSYKINLINLRTPNCGIIYRHDSRHDEPKWMKLQSQDSATGKFIGIQFCMVADVAMHVTNTKLKWHSHGSTSLLLKHALHLR